MQISEQFPSFTKPSLVLAIDAKRARILLAQDRTIGEYRVVTLPQAPLRSGSGHATVRGRGRTIVRGTVPERKNDARFRRLLRALNAELLTAISREHIGALYLFAPDQLLKGTLAALHSSLKRLVVQTVPADYAHARPQQLVARLAQERKRLPEKLKAKRMPR